MYGWLGIDVAKVCCYDLYYGMKVRHVAIRILWHEGCVCSYEEVLFSVR